MTENGFYVIYAPRNEHCWLRRAGVLVEGEGHMYYWGDEEAVPLARLPDDTLLPIVRGPEMIHAAVIGGDSQ